MAVYKHTYRAYVGKLTPLWSRPMILTRSSYARLFQNRFLAIFLALCFFYPMLCVAYIYLMHNNSFLLLFRIQPGQLWQVDGRFFYLFCNVQGALAYLLIAFIGPNLVSPDLVNGAMQLYFSRPFSRLEYVVGKISVLMILLSMITWVPGLSIYTIEGSIEGWDWFTAHFWLAGALFISLFAWIFVLSLLALAMSAWVKWKIAAGALVLGIFFAGAGLGNAINQVMHTSYGSLIDLTEVVHTVWADLLRYDSGATLSVAYAWTVLVLACVLCAWLLARRIRAFEVVK
jgi:ABC-2 type transport system permease protein